MMCTRAKMQIVGNGRARRSGVPRHIFAYIMYQKENTDGWF